MDSSFCPHPWQAGQKGVPWERTEGTMDFLEIEKMFAILKFSLQFKDVWKFKTLFAYVKYYLQFQKSV